MNEWVKKSIELANSEGYLDNLSEIYPIEDNEKRDISEDKINAIKEAYDKKDFNKLIEIFMGLDRFPIDDSYVAFMKKNNLDTKSNPKTVERIGKKLLSIEFDKLIEEAQKPKSASRQIGKMFRKWVRTLNYPILEEDEFVESKEICILDGSDNKLKEFAERVLGCNLEKGVDIIFKVNNKYIIGEAKFLTDIGGTQNNQFYSAINLVKHGGGQSIRIAILDGVVWLKGKNKMHLDVKNLDGIALSALLLKDFIKSLE
tara:strand:+ start:41 stop:814 length:774 start_codon:yes stop_codon:yes gene_type:complete